MRHGFFAMLMFAGGLSAPAQQVTAPISPYTLRTTARAVVTDVLVQDRKGNPVRGLPATAFHLIDNGKSVNLSSVEEHTGSERPQTAPATLAAGVYTNDPARLPSVLNIVVIDITSLSLPDQMFLANQLDRFAASLPADISVAVYLRSGARHAVLIQDFTDDRSRIQQAFRSALPRFPSLDAVYQSGLAALQQIASDLGDLPGRKNVIWFTGGAPLTLDPLGFTATPSQDTRPLFDELERERISIFPVDARGLQVSEPLGGFTQRGLMMDVAEATGGVPYYNTNGLAWAAAQVVNADRSFYTLTYTPTFTVDNKWHKVKVQADGHSLHLSYRRGYFADDEHVAKPGTAHTRARLLTSGRTVQEEPMQRQAPIVFYATVLPLPAGAAKPQIATQAAAGTTRYRVHYIAPVDAFQRHVVDGESRMDLHMGVMAMNLSGTFVARRLRQAVYTIHEDKLTRQPTAQVAADVDVDLPGGDDFLYLVVWDPAGERMGALNVHVHVPK